MGSNIVRFAPQIAVPIASITNSYTKFGTPFEHPMRLIHFINDTNGTFQFSFDGTTDNFPVIGETFNLYDLTSDQDSTESFRYEKGSQLWVKWLIEPSDTGGELTDTMYAVLVYGKGE